MNKVINLKPQQHSDVETAFVALLDDYCNREDTVKPLSNSFFERIEQLKTKAETAKHRREKLLLEG